MKPVLKNVIGESIAELGLATYKTVESEITVESYRLRGELKDLHGRIIEGTWWRIIETHDGALVRWALLKDRADVDRLAREWIKPSKSVVTHPARPSGCESITPGDKKRHREAAEKLIARKFPTASKTGSAKDWQIEVTEFSGMKQPIVPGVKTKSLKQARRNFIRRSKRNLMIMVDVDLRNGWFVRGYCYMTAKKLAAAISERLGLTTPLTPKQIKMRRLALELHTKRNSGPEPV